MAATQLVDRGRFGVPPYRSGDPNAWSIGTELSVATGRPCGARATGSWGTADAEDCFQETFLAAVQVWRSRTCSVSPWPASTARNCPRISTGCDAGIRQRRHETGNVEWEDLSAVQLRRTNWLNPPTVRPPPRGAGRLARQQAQAFCLFYLDGWDYQQIAAHLEATVNAVGVLLHRARHRLRDLLGSAVAEEL